MNTVFAMLAVFAVFINLPKLGHLISPSGPAAIVWEADELASAALTIDSGLAASYELALKRCVQVNVPCNSLFERRQEIANGFASCNDGSKMCQAVQQYHQSMNYSKVFDGGKHTLELPDKPYWGQIGNILLDQFAERENYKHELLLRWSRQWVIELVVSCFFLFGLLAYGINKWLWRAKVSSELQSAEDVPGDNLVEYSNSLESESDPENYWRAQHINETTLSHEAFARFIERDRKSGELIRRFRDENWSEDRLNLEFISAGLIDNQRTAIAMILIAEMRKKFEQW